MTTETINYLPEKAVDMKAYDMDGIDTCYCRLGHLFV
jgi:hypothetical protein